MEAGGNISLSFELPIPNTKDQHFVFQKFSGSGWDAASAKFGLGTSTLALFSSCS